MPHSNTRSDVLALFHAAWDQGDLAATKRLSVGFPSALLLDARVQLRLARCINAKQVIAAEALYRRLLRFDVSDLKAFIGALERSNSKPFLIKLYELCRRSRTLAGSLTCFLALYNLGQVHAAKSKWVTALAGRVAELGGFASYSVINAFDSPNGGNAKDNLCVLVSRFTAVEDVLPFLKKGANVSFVTWRISPAALSNFHNDLVRKAPANVKASDLRFVNPIIEDGNLNDPDIEPWSRLADQLSNSVISALENKLPFFLRRPCKDARGTLELALSDAMFGLLRWRFCLERTVRALGQRKIVAWCRDREELEWAQALASNVGAEISIYPSFPTAAALRTFPRELPSSSPAWSAFTRAWLEARLNLLKTTEIVKNSEFFYSVVGQWEPLSQPVLDVAARQLDLGRVLSVSVCPNARAPDCDVVIQRAPFKLPVRQAVRDELRGRLVAVLAGKHGSVVEPLTRIALNFIERELPNLAMFYHAGRVVAVRSKLAPSVICPTRITSLRAYCDGVRSVGGASSEIQSVFWSKMPRYRRPTADIVFAIETYTADLLTSWYGLAANSVKLVGNIRTSYTGNAGNDGHRIGWRKKATKMIVATQSVPLQQNLALLRAVVPTLQARAIDVVVKVHPSEQKASIEAYKAELASSATRGKSWVIQATPMSTLLPAVDMVISRSSNVALEAAVAGKDVVLLHESSEPMVVPYAEMGVAMVCDTAEALTDVVARILDGGPERARLRETRERYLAGNPLLVNGRGVEVIRRTLRDMRAASTYGRVNERIKVALSSTMVGLRLQFLRND